jgi:hypothetical protein
MFISLWPERMPTKTASIAIGCHAHVFVGMFISLGLARMPTKTWAWHPHPCPLATQLRLDLFAVVPTI